MVLLSLAMWVFERKHVWTELCGNDNASSSDGKPPPSASAQGTDVDVVVDPTQQPTSAAVVPDAREQRIAGI